MVDEIKEIYCLDASFVRDSLERTIDNLDVMVFEWHSNVLI